MSALYILFVIGLVVDLVWQVSPVRLCHILLWEPSVHFYMFRFIELTVVASLFGILAYQSAASISLRETETSW